MLGALETVEERHHHIAGAGAGTIAVRQRGARDGLRRACSWAGHGCGDGGGGADLRPREVASSVMCESTWLCRAVCFMRSC